jgi:hypothetical protein
MYENIQKAGKYTALIDRPDAFPLDCEKISQTCKGGYIYE